MGYIYMDSGLYLGGTQPKRIIDGRYFKQDTMGYESVSEAIISELEHYILDIDFVDYEMGICHTSLGILYGCYSEDFKRGGYSELSLYKIIDNEEYSCLGSAKEKLEYIESKVSKICGYGVHEWLGKHILLDAITLNPDRHLNNFILLRKGNKCIYGPIMDNGLGLLSNIEEFPMNIRNINTYLSSVSSKPFTRRFSNQVKLFDDIDRLQINMSGFKNKLDLVWDNVPFKVECFKRAKKILLRQLEKTEGVLWNEVSF